MAVDDTSAPMSEADAVPPPPTTELRPAEPLKGAAVAVEPAEPLETAIVASAPTEPVVPDAVPAPVTTSGSSASVAPPPAGQNGRVNLAGLGDQAGDKVREFAAAGKDKVAGLLDQLTQLLEDAAGQVDERLGSQFGDHARSAAGTVQGFADAVRAKDVDAVADDVRGFVRRSPAAAVGVAAALGFAAARAVHAGLDQRA